MNLLATMQMSFFSFVSALSFSKLTRCKDIKPSSRYLSNRRNSSHRQGVLSFYRNTLFVLSSLCSAHALADIDISTTVSTACADSSGTFSGSNCQVDPAAIVAYLNGGQNVNVEASGSINVLSDIAKSGGGTVTLTLKATARVQLNATISSDVGNPLNVILWSDIDNTNAAGVSLSGNISSAGGHVWVGGSASNNGSSVWNGLTVGNGPSVGSVSNNFNAVDFMSSQIVTDGGDVLIWAGDGHTAGGGISGIAVFADNDNRIIAGAGDVSLITDSVLAYSGSANSLLVSSTGHFTLLPNTTSAPLTWSHNENYAGSSINFSSAEYNYLLFNADLSATSGISLGDYTGMAGVTFNYAGAITLNNSVQASGPITVRGGTVDVGVNGNISSSNTGAILIETSSSANTAMRVVGNINKTGGSESTLTIKAAGRVYLEGDISSTTGTPLNVVLWSDHNDGNEGGVSALGSISTFGGHVWIGGSTDGGATSSVWNGLTVGDGPSIGASGSNGNALDYGAVITTNGGDVLIWAGSGVDNNSTTDGIRVKGDIVTTISTDTGDVTLIADYIDCWVCSGTSLSIESTGHFTLLPNKVSQPITWTHNENYAGLNFASPYNYLYFASDFSTMSAVTLGNYTGMSGVTFNYQGAVTLNNSLSANGPVSVYGGSIRSGASGAITATNGDVILDADTGSDLGGDVVSMSLDGNITTTGSGNISLVSRGHTGTGDVISMGAVSVSAAGSLSVETIRPAVGSNRGLQLTGASLSAGGDITMIGSSGTNAVWDINLNGASITSTAGNISITSVGAQTNDQFTLQGTNSITTGSGNITLSANYFNVSGNTLTISTPGILTIEPTNVGFNTDLDANYGEFAQDVFSWSASGSPNMNVAGTLANTTILNADTMQGVVLGNSTNTSQMVIAGETNLGGTFTVYGGNIDQTGTVTTGGNLRYEVSKTDHADGFDAIAITGDLDAGSGIIFLIAESGDVVIDANITTTSTLTSAMVISAGNSYAPNDSSGGDVVILSGTLTTGAGGNLTIYTGDYFNSTGVSALTNLNVTYRESRPPVPKALKINGASQYVTLPNSGWADISNTITIEGWFKVDSSANGDIITRHNNSTATVQLLWGLRYRDNAFMLHISDTTNHYRCTSQTDPNADGKWHHVAAMFETGVGIRIFIDGVEEAVQNCVTVGTGLNLTIPNSGVNALIGRYYNGGSPFVGSMDELRVWSTTRTEQQIRENMMRTVPADSAGLVAYYTFEHDSGTFVSDVSGNGLHGTLTGNDSNWVDTRAFNSWLGNSTDWNDSANWSLGNTPVHSDNVGLYPSANNPTIAANGSGPAGSALDFDGIDDYVAFADANILDDLTSMTIEVWVWGIDPNGSAVVTKDGVFSLETGSTGNVAMYFGDGTTTSAGTNTIVTGALSDNQWNHIAASRDGSGNVMIYVNGIFVGSGVDNDTGANANGLSIGGYPPPSTYKYEGKLDDVRIWNITRTEAEIRATMNSTLSGSETGLIAYYKFDEGSGTTLTDSTSNGNNGTLTFMEEADWVASTALIGNATTRNLFVAAGTNPTLNTSVDVEGNLFLDQSVNLNGQTIDLGFNGYLYEMAGLFSDSLGTGGLSVTRDLTNISAENVGGLGAILTTTANMGTTTIIRSHGALTDPISIKRQYDIAPTTNTGLNATLVFNYDDTELNGINEDFLLLYKSTDSGATWTSQSATVLDTTANTMTLSGLDGFSVWTGSMDPLIDTDGDGEPDITDTDDDNDGLSDSDELTLGTNPLVVDTDGDGISDGDEVANGGNPLNAPPVIAQSSPLTITIDEDESPTAWVSPSVVASDLDGDTLTWALSRDGLHGTASVSGTGSSPATLDYTPDADYYGVDYFELTVTDGTESDTLTIKVIVNAQPEPGDPAAGGASAINNFIPYTVSGLPVYDHEGSSDPTNGGASVQPTAIDIGSCSADGATPGNQPSTWIKYEDTDTNLNTTNDAYLVMRMRLDANPSEKGRNGPGLISSHWNFMIDVENDGSNDYIIDVDGTFASSQLDRVWMYQDDNNNFTIDDGAAVNTYIAAGTNATSAQQATSVVTIIEDTSVVCGSTHDYFLDVRIPVDDFPDSFANYDANVGIGVFYSSSASNTDPLQKDWQGFRDVPPDTFEAINGGFAAPIGSIAGSVFVDSNGDDFYQNTLEGAHSSQSIDIFTEAGVQLVAGVDYTFTDNGDSYSVTGLAAGNYRIRNTASAGVTQLTKNVTVQGAATAAIDIPVRTISEITVFVYEDLDGDGFYDAGELGVDGANIELDGVSQGNTSGGGLLTIDFTAKADGPYTLTQALVPAGYVASSALNVTVNYTSGTNLSVSFGVVKSGEISGVVYVDKDGDTTKDSSEAGLSGVAITVTDEGDAIVGTTVTGTDGSYRITGLTPNTKYYVSETNPSGYASTTSDLLPTSFGSGGSSIINFGDVPSGKVSGFVFSDDNGNSRVDDGEQGLQFVTITIYNQSNATISIGGITYQPGDIVTAVRTDAGGFYEATLPEGRYRIEETDPLGYVSVSANSKNVTLPSTQTIANFADMKKNVVTGLVYNDLNANGKLDVGEPGVNGVTMTITSGPVVDVTQSDGSFYFGDLSDGDYTLSITVPTGFVSTTVESKSVTISSTNVNAGLQFGVKISGTVEGDVYHDLNGNLRRDPGEEGIGGVTLTLDGGTTTTSLINGHYSFIGLTASQSYEVVETDPTHYVSTTTNSVTVALDANGRADRAATFGDQFQGVVAGTVFEDLDASGNQDALEQSLPGVVMSLTGFNDSLSSNSGSFEFVNVSGSGLSLSATVPNGYAVTTNNNPETIDMTAYDGSSNYGLQPDATVLAYVFSDANSNGVQDGEEGPLAGATVSMTSGETGVTDANGLIRLSGITPGLNTVSVGAVSGYSDTTATSIQLYAEAGQTASVRFGKFINLAPWARPETFTLAENSTPTIVGSVVAGDDNGDLVTYSISAGNDAGLFTINANTGVISLIGALDFETASAYTLTITVSDGSLTSTADISISVTDINEAPIANDQTLVVNEDTLLPLTLTGFDVDGDILTYTVTTQPSNGSLSGVAPNLTYTPNANFNGSDSFTFTVSDSVFGSNTATVNITVNSVNDLPVATEQSLSTNEDTALSIALTGSDIDGSIVGFNVITGPASGVLSGTAPNLTYTPTANFNGSDVFTYTVTDNEGGISNAASVSITVTPINDAPVADSQTLSTNEDSPLALVLAGTDIDGTIASYTIVTSPTSGVLSGTAPNFTYTPNNDFNGSDSFTFSVTDDLGATSVAASVSISVVSINDLPIATAQSVSVDEDAALGVTLSGTDVDGTIASYSISSGPTNGVLSGTAPNLTYTSTANFNGSDVFTYTVTDNEGGISNAASVSITVTPINDAPVANSQTLSTDEDSPLALVLAGTDIDGTIASYTIVTSPTSGVLSGTAPNFTYTPNNDFNGSDSFTFSVTDDLGVTSVAASVSISVISINDLPIATAQSVSVDEDAALGVTLSGTDVDGTIASYSISSGPTNGVLSGTAPNLTYTPTANFNGSDQFTFTVTDNEGAISTDGTVSISVLSINDAPVAADDTVSATEDTQAIIDVLANDLDVENALAPSSIVITQQPLHGTLSIVPSSGLVFYTPALNYSGSDSFSYQVNDSGNLTSNIATVSIEVAAVNDAPVANSEALSTNEDMALNIDLLANDVDIDSAALVADNVTITTEPLNGVLSTDNGIFTYSPAANYVGNDSFQYRVSDEQGLSSNIATVFLTVIGINDAPIAVNDVGITDEDTSINIAVLNNDSDVEDGQPDASTVQVIQQPLHGSITINANTGVVTYTPDADYFGADSFVYLVDDTGNASPVEPPLHSNPATVDITVNAVNDAPRAANDVVIHEEIDSPITINVLGNDVDVDGSLVVNTLTIITQPQFGTISVNTSSGVVQYTPAPEYNGDDRFSYQVADDSGALSNVADVLLTITAVNDAPVAQSQSVITDEDVAISIELMASDVDGSIDAYTIETQPSFGQLSGTAPNLIYTPNINFNGADSFSFVAVDNEFAVSSSATVSINVSAVNDLPNVADDAVTVAEDSSVTIIDVLSNDGDVDGDTLAIIEANSSSGQVTINPDGTLSFTPDPDFSGVVTVTYTVSDGNGGTQSATLTITVSAVNDVPNVQDDTATIAEDSVNNTIDVLSNDTDIDGDTLTVVSATASSGQVSINPDGTLRYSPVPDFFGVVTISYTVSDGQGGTASATVTITIESVNDLPVAVAQNVVTNEDANLAIMLSGTDIDGTITGYTVVEQPGHGDLIGTAPNLTYVPFDNFNGADSFTFSVTDDETGVSAAATINIVVNPVDDAPFAADDLLQTPEDTQVVINILDNDFDPESNLVSASVFITEQPMHGVVSITPTTGLVFYTPEENYHGVDSFKYRVKDSTNLISNEATVSIEIMAVNDAPLANADAFNTSEDSAIDLTLLANDIDIDADVLDINSLVITSAPQHGALIVQDGIVTYTPQLDFVGNDSFTYKVADALGLESNIADVYITVTGVNDAPIAVDDIVQTNEDTAVVVEVLANDSDVEDGQPDPATVQIIQAPQHGSVVINSNTGAVTYTPEQDFYGADSFVYFVDDTGNASPLEPPLHSNPAKVSITVNSVNDAPIARNDVIVHQELNSPLDINVLGNDIDVDGTLNLSSLRIVSAPQFGSVSVDAATGLVKYTPEPQYNGSDMFTYQISDDVGLVSNVATVTLTITAVNDAPIAEDQSITILEDTSSVIELVASDIDGTVAFYYVDIQPSNGVLSGKAPELVYTPNTNYFGTDSFAFSVIDDQGLSSNIATVTIAISEVNDTPTAVPLMLSTEEGQSLPITLDGVDVDGDALTFIIDSQPTNGSLSGSGRSWIYTPNPGFVAEDSFSYIVNDGATDSQPATVSITVYEAEPAVNAVDDDFEIAANTTALLDVLANDTSAGGAALALVSASSTYGEVAIVDGQIQFVPPQGFSGTVIIRYLVRNAQGEFDTATVTVTVVSDGQGPVITAPNSVTVDATAMYTKVDLGVASARDRNGNPLPVSFVSGSLYFEPGVNYALWQATDSDGNISTAEQLVYVRPLVSLSKDQRVVEGMNVKIGVFLNGFSPNYPLEIPYTVSGTSDASDHTLSSGVLVINEGTQGFINVAIVDDFVSEEDETLIVTLTDANNVGVKREHIITITEGNIAPQVELLMEQNSRERLTVAQNEGVAVISTNVSDPNLEDNHSYEWQMLRGDATDLDAQSDTFTFDPSLMAEGLYVVQVTVTDDGAPALSQTVDLYFEVVAQLPVLGQGDSDGDLIPDDSEGFADADEDGIPDYLDSRSECNVLMEQSAEQDAFLVEGEPGVCLRVGFYAYSGELLGAQLSQGDIDKPGDELVEDTEALHVDGVFDFIARGLPEFGSSYRVVIPQRQIIPQLAVYRKFTAQKNWFTFVEDDNNLLHSASGDKGFCPPPGSEQWQSGLVAGFWCVQLTIEDGGPNDADGKANGTIVDPGGVAVLNSPNQSPVALDDEVSIVQDSSITINVISNDSDPDGDTLSVLFASATLGSVSIGDNSELIYTPLANYVGADQIDYSIGDGKGGTASALVSITISPQAQAPTPPPQKSDDIVTKGGGAIGIWWLLLCLGGGIRYVPINRVYCRNNQENA